MATNLEFSITLEPVGYDHKWPEFYIKIDEQLQDHCTLTQTATYNFDVTVDDGDHTIAVGFVNKDDSDTQVVENQIVADKALIVKSVAIEGYALDDFLYRANYYPAGRAQSHSNYLSWNGEWQLEITTPIFTWIHKTQYLGWIYEKNL
jgi:hypothetical protein